MSQDSADPEDAADEARAIAIDQLRELGLSTYAARTYVALILLGEGGTAREINDIADVPRTRVYDAAEELRDVGLVDVQHASPKRFWPVSSETAGRQFHREYAHRVDTLTDALEEMEPPSRNAEQRGVWTVTGRDAVTDRLVEFVDDAEEEIAFMTVDSLLTDRVVEALQVASDRGVTIKLGGISGPVEDAIREEVPRAELFESIWVHSDTPAGRILLVDGTRTLTSVLVSAGGDHPPEPRDETAIWGVGETNSLVVVLRAMFTWQLGETGE
jgi:sugar-specific transcriptional regulator TrmB